MAQFSLRKVAFACGVSHNAPYAHFKDIEALIAAMSEYVTVQFMDSLTSALQEAGSENNTITTLGKAYILFFSEHPKYFQFLFYHSGVLINLDTDGNEGFPPFTLFRDTAYKAFDTLNLATTTKKQALVSMWSLVHGITALLTNDRIKYSGDWQEILDTIDIHVGGENL